MRTRSSIPVLALLAVAVLAAGCAATDDDDATAGGARPLAGLPNVPGATTTTPAPPATVYNPDGDDATVDLTPITGPLPTMPLILPNPLAVKCANYVQIGAAAGDVRVAPVVQAANGDASQYYNACNDLATTNPDLLAQLAALMDAYDPSSAFP